ncbi:RNA polymerase I-specific transcription initiation factor RRN3 [Obelidium mucronatum]|nr:RNA polymerase I-specific transcription initiation factor RRN3 [Obelidium mucronatum]
MDANTAGLSGRALVAWLRGLSDNVSQLGGEAARPTVDAVLRCRAWLDADADDAADADADALAAYAQLLENLVSAHALLVRPVVLALVQTLAAAAADSPAARSAKYDRIHHVLHAVIRLIPSGPSFMHAMLSDAFPHKSENVLDQMWYLKNLFRIVSYAPVLRNSVWALAIDRATQIDVEIQSALDDLSEEDYNQVLAHCFDIDAVGHDRESISFMSPKTFATAGRVGTIPDELQLDDDDDDRRQRGSEDRTDNFSSSDEDSDEDDSEEESDEDDDAPPPLVVSDFKIMSGKLDSIIHYLLGQITLIFSPPPLSAQNGSSSTNDLKSRTASAKSINQSETREEALEFFSVLLQIFERTILPTHQCKYVQFLYFHACSMSSKCTESFLVLLAQKTFDTSSPAIIRVAASAYLSSFVARAKFVEIEAVLYCLKMLNGWALTYVDENESSVKTGGVLDGGKTHACFYAVIQALLYVFCFRWREIVAAAGVGGDDSLNDGRNIEYGRLPVEMNGFQKLVQSRFHPLKVCTKSVVAEFARITHKLDMLYCYTHIQQRPVLTNSTSANTLRPPPPQPAFFPFDPCHLIMSKSIIEPGYNEWMEEDDIVGGGVVGGRDSDIDYISSSFDNQMSMSAD